MDDLNRILNSTFKALIFLLLPISALIIAQSEPVVYLVFSHTRLHGADSPLPLRRWLFSRWDVCVGSSVYFGAWILCHARHDHARGGWDL